MFAVGIEMLVRSSTGVLNPYLPSTIQTTPTPQQRSDFRLLATPVLPICLLHSHCNGYLSPQDAGPDVIAGLQWTMGIRPIDLYRKVEFESETSSVSQRSARNEVAERKHKHARSWLIVYAWINTRVHNRLSPSYNCFQMKALTAQAARQPWTADHRAMSRDLYREYSRDARAR